jgi:hypothetical protein
MRKVLIHLGGSEITLRDQRLILLFCALRRASTDGLTRQVGVFSLDSGIGESAKSARP